MEDGRSHFINGEAMVSYLQVFKQLVEQLGWICELFGTLYSRAQRLKETDMMMILRNAGFHVGSASASAVQLSDGCFDRTSPPA